jgi:UDP-glucose 4-epimerase
MSKKILVTGGFGFIGSHLVEDLLKDPNNFVHVVDNLSSNPLPFDYLLKEFGEQPRLSYSICSVEEFCNKPQIDLDFSEIYHLASVVGPAGVLPHAGKIIKMIVNDTYSLIDLALKCGARLLDVSTSEVYGGGREGFCSETMSKIIPSVYSPRVEYAIAKLAAEAALINTAKVTSLDIVIVRPFNVCGPRQSGVGGFVLPRFIAQALENQNLTVFGDGNQIRAFTNVKDIVEGIILAMRRGKRGEIYNLGNPKNRCTINELADAVIRITGTKGRKIYVDPKSIYGPLYEEANDKFPDAEKAIKELGWQPKYSRDETIQQTVEYFRQLPPSLRERLSGKVESPRKV